MKEKILYLKTQGKSYREIQRILGCPKSLISYYLGKNQKQKTVHRTSLLRRKKKQALVAVKGGKCEICGYNKCLSALEFHHIDPEKKDFALGDSRVLKLELLKKEIEKCQLVCSNCHREIHESSDLTLSKVSGSL